MPNSPLHLSTPLALGARLITKMLNGTIANLGSSWSALLSSSLLSVRVLLEPTLERNITRAPVALAGILTSIFLLEAFVAQLYDGPGAHIFVSLFSVLPSLFHSFRSKPLIPTILFTLLIPNFIKVSAGYLEAMTEKENHRSHDGWHSSMTLKG